MDIARKWSPVHYLSLLIIIIIGVAFRAYQFDLRPLHHDESLHGLYSLYYFQNSASGFYKYNPLLHGPLLYHSLPWSYWLFGVSKFATRIPSVLLGSLLLFLPILFKNRLSKYTILVATMLIAVSPTMVYWSRFIRHDNFIFALLFMLLFAIFKTRGILRYLLIALSIALQFSCKENTYIHLLFFVTFLFYEALIIKLTNQGHASLAKGIITSLKNNKILLACSLILFLLIFSHYYSAGFVYPEGVLDGAYRKSLLYWFEQHQAERIAGPFSYTFLINTFFESWWIPVILTHLIYFYIKQTGKIKLLFLSSIILSLIFHLFLGNPSEYYFIDKILKLKIPLDYYLFFPILFHSLILTTTYLIEERRDLALTGFLFFSSLFTYSYLGEKVPWLALYPFVTGLVFFSFFFDKVFQKPVLLLLLPLLALNIKTLIWTNFTNSHDPKNLLSQVHTSQEFETLMQRLRKSIDSSQPTDYFLVNDSYTWPTTWYMHGSKGYHFYKSKKDMKTYQYILAKPEDNHANMSLRDTHDKTTLPLRLWWLPAYKELSVINSGKYYLNKETWNQKGSTQVSLWTKKKDL